MFRSLVRASLFLFSQQKKIFKIIDKKKNITRLIKTTMTNLFSDYQKVVLLSKTFRLFPSFFTKDLLKKMLDSQFMEEYLNYILIHQHIDDVHDKDLKKILKSLRMDRNYERRILQIYINYIKRTSDLTENQYLMQIFDIRNPQNWFKSAFSGQRQFIYHHGPTNSGKTFSAINQLRNLKQTQKGIYMAPLRLLAWQTQQRLGKCNLITGQQKDYQNSHLTSCTIQAGKLNEIYDVAIIDQIQMIGDLCRGWSWTTPILGIKANKIHLCGDQRALSLISKLIQKSGGSLSQKKYSRLSKLQLIKRNFVLNDIRPGDCIIDFQARKLYEYRKIINNFKGTQDKPCKTAIVYGKMPPRCRKIQAQKFNSGQLPYLVASDAIGMGLNLNIRRIIFINLTKMGDQGKQRVLYDHQIRQIAGRAGRGYGTGYVQCVNYDMRDKVKYALRTVNISLEENLPQIDQKDINYQAASQYLDLNIKLNQKDKDKDKDKENNNVQEELIKNKGYKNIDQRDPNQLSNIQNMNDMTDQYDNFLKRNYTQDQMRIKKAGIYFPSAIIQRIQLKMQEMFEKKVAFSQTVRLIEHLSKQNKQLYFVQKNQDLCSLSDDLQHLKLPFHTHYTFSRLPFPQSTSKMVRQKILNYAKQFKYIGQVKIPQEFIKIYEQKFKEYTKISHVRQLQQIFMIMQAYTWLWNHFQLYFPQNQLAVKIKDGLCDKMTELLDNSNQMHYSNKKAQEHNHKAMQVLGAGE